MLQPIYPLFIEFNKYSEHSVVYSEVCSESQILNETLYEFLDTPENIQILLNSLYYKMSIK